MCMCTCMCTCRCVKVDTNVCMYVCGFVCDCVSPPNFTFTYLSQYCQRTALDWASERGHHEIVQLLIEVGADVNRLDVVRVVYI